MGTLLEKATVLYFASFLSMGLLLKERICSSRSKFFPLRVDPIAKCYVHPEKQTGTHANYIKLFLEKRQGVFKLTL